MLALPTLQQWALYEIMPLPCVILSPRLRVIAVNKCFLTETGLKREETIDRFFFDLLFADANTEALLSKSFNKALSTSGEDEVKLLTGNLYKQDIDSSTLYNWNIKNVALKGAQSGEDQLILFARKENADIHFLANIARHIEDPIITTDEDLNITRWNRAAERMFKWTAAEAIGKNAVEILKVHFPPVVRDAVINDINIHGYWQGDVSFLDRMGKQKTALCTASQLKDNSNQVAGNLILIKDITRRIEAERELAKLNQELECRVDERTAAIKRTEQKYQQLFENNPAPMWVMDPANYSFLAVNEMAIFQYGYSRQEFLSMTVLDIRPDEEKELFFEADHTFLTTAENYNRGIWKHKKKDGSIFFVQVIAHDTLFEGTPAKMILASDITERMLAQEKLAAREVFFRSIIENSAEGVSLMDAGYRNIYRSPAALRIMGPLTHDNPIDLAHPADREAIEKIRDTFLKTPGEPQPFLGRFKNSTGEYLCLEGTFTNLLNVKAINGIVTNFRDVTERILAEEKIAASEQRFRSTLHNMMEGAQIIDFNWTYLYLNDALEATSRYRRQELIGKTMMEKYPGIENTKLFKTLQKVMKGRVSKQMDTEFVFPDGSVAHFQLSIQPVPEGIFILSIDITDRKNAELEIANTQANLQTVMERISDAFIALDNDWNYVYVNKEAGIMLSREPADLLGKNIFEEFPDIVGHSFERAYTHAMETQEHIRLEEYYAPLDLWLENNIYPSPRGLSLFFTDITGRKKAALQLATSEENLKAIFDNASEGFILTDTNGIVKAYNNTIIDSLLINVFDKIKQGETIFNVVEADRKAFFMEVFQKVLTGKTVAYDRKYTSNDGRDTWVNLVFNPVKSNDEIQGVCIAGRNVTKQKNAEEQLKKSFAENLALAERLSATLNNIPAKIALLNKEGVIIEVNDAWCSPEAEGFIGKNMAVGENYIDEAQNLPFENKEAGSSIAVNVSDVLEGRSDEFVNEYTYREDGEQKWYRLVVTALKQKSYAGAVMMHLVISEIRKLEAERMRQQLEQQQKITQAILQGQEKERNHIGQELHDNINQILAGTRMYLSIAGSKDEIVKESIRYPMQLLDQSMEEIRTLCKTMVTPLQDIQLKEMIQDLLAKLAQLDIEVLFEYNVPDDPLSDELKLNVYRIIQELTHNITKYAQASRVTVDIWLKEGLLHIIVMDNGKGFNSKAKRDGIGISNIRSRVSSFGGTIEIESTIGTGTTTVIRVPYVEEN
ncbi:MAG: PAS domain S-box protein [Rhizobacter sp.]|nr:PAS domain S-box protein [Ferruginibacter sp.]